MLRLLLAVSIMLVLLIPITFGVLALGLPHWLSLSLLAGFFLLPFLLDGSLFNRRKTLAQQLIELETKGLLEQKRFQIKRVFGIQAVERKGAQYYLELEDDRVLYLAGSLLDAYEPTHTLKRRFPCSEFIVYYHKIDQTVLSLEPQGTVLEPELYLPPLMLICEYPPPRLKSGAILQKSYEVIKQEQIKRTGV